MEKKNCLDKARLQEGKNSNQRIAIMAAKLLSKYFGIPAEPIFESAGLNSKYPPNHKDRFFKDVSELGIRGEAQKIRIQVVNENGLIIAESNGLFSVSETITLLKKLPLPLSPAASRWVKYSLQKDYLSSSQNNLQKQYYVKQEG